MKIINAARDIPVANASSKFMVVGFPGSGKSTLAATLPGKTLVWGFDPAIRDAYEGLAHVDLSLYEMDIPDMTVYSIAKTKTTPDVPINIAKEPQAYRDFGKDFIEAVNDKLYEKYDNWVFDSNTMLQYMIMDAVLHKNQRYGKTPQQDDYPAQMGALTKTYRSACGLPIRVMFIFHDVFKQDDKTKRMMYIPMLVGMLKGSIPSLFGHLLRCYVDKEGGKTCRLIQTEPDNFCNTIRTSFKKINRPYHDVTVEDFTKIQDYGLGKIIKENS